jgi:hypothetical protein
MSRWEQVRKAATKKEERTWEEIEKQLLEDKDRWAGLVTK